MGVSGPGRRVVLPMGRRVVWADMLGLGTAAPGVRLERYRWSRIGCHLIPGHEIACGTGLLIASERVVPHAGGPGR